MRNPRVQLVIGLILSAVFLYIAMRPVKIADLLVALRSFNWWFAFPFLAVTWGGFYIRAIRWHYLLKPTASFSSWRLFKPMMAGFAVNSVFPARLGEFARAYVLGRRENIPFMSVFATIVVERIFDSLTILLLLPIALAGAKISPTFSVRYGEFEITGAAMSWLSQKLAIMVVVLLAGSFLLLWGPARRFFQTCIDRLTFLPAKLRGILVGAVDHFTQGLHSLRDFRSWVIVIGLSVATWVAAGLTMPVLAWGFAGMKLGVAAGIAITVITCIAILIPAAPGYWGLMELGIVFGMTVLGVVPNDEAGYATALAYAFIYHAVSIFTIIAVGLYFLYHEQVTLTELSHAKEEVE